MLSALSPTIRAATDQDVGARRLAGPVLVAERRGVPLAALSMADGQTVTDPFHPAPAALVALRVRAGALSAVRRRPQLRDRLRAGVRIAPVPATAA